MPFLRIFSARYRDCGKQVYLGTDISDFLIFLFRISIPFHPSDQNLVHGYGCFLLTSGGFDTAHAAAR